MFTALRRLLQLSPAQRQLHRRKQVEGEFAPAALIELLRPLAQFDGVNDRARGRTGCLLVPLAIVWVVMLLMCAANGDWSLWPALLALGIVVAVLAFLQIQLSMLDISNNLRETALPFLALLREDMAPDRLVWVRIDLRSPLAKAKRVGVPVTSKRPPYRKIVDTRYRDPWFQGRCELADGSRLRWDVRDDLLVSKRGKYNARNKYKTKVKQYRNTLLRVIVELPVKNYAVRPARDPIEARAQLRAGAKRTTIKLRRKHKSRGGPSQTVDQLIDLVSSAFRRALPAVTG